MYQGFANYYDYLMRDVDYALWANYLLSLIEENVGEGSKRILDAACGTGNISLPLQMAGHVVSGADSSEDMLHAAAEKSRDAGLQIPFVYQRLQEIELHRPVDVIVCACDGVNYLTTDEDLQAFLASSHNALREGGLLLFDISSRYKLTEILADRCFGEDLDEIAYLWQNSYDPKTQLLQMDLSFFVQKKTSKPRKQGAKKIDDGSFSRFRETHFQRAYEEQHLVEAMESAGLADVRVYDAFTRSPANDRSERIQFVAVKK